LKVTLSYAFFLRIGTVSRTWWSGRTTSWQ